jgi:putative ABC transport system substrate-binding protein
VRTSTRQPAGLLAGLLIICLFASDISAQTVAIVSTDTLQSTRRSISGARSTIQADYPDVKFLDVQLSSDAAVFAAQLDTIRQAKPALLLTVGSGATQTAKDNFSDRPIVFSSVLYPVISGFAASFARPGNNMTGASLDIPTDIQFEKCKQIVPSMKKVGVLYTSNTASLIPSSRVVAAEMGLELVAIEVKTQKDLPKALDSLAKVVDVLWSVADHNLFDPQTTKYILLNSMRHGLPFMGFSRHVVESGALFALDFDYKAIGNRPVAGESLLTRKPGEIPVRARFQWFHYTEKTAQHLNNVIPPELVAVARRCTDERLPYIAGLNHRFKFVLPISVIGHLHADRQQLPHLSARRTATS